MMWFNTKKDDLPEQDAIILGIRYSYLSGDWSYEIGWFVCDQSEKIKWECSEGIFEVPDYWTFLPDPPENRRGKK